MASENHSNSITQPPTYDSLFASSDHDENDREAHPYAREGCNDVVIVLRGCIPAASASGGVTCYDTLSGHHYNSVSIGSNRCVLCGEGRRGREIEREQHAIGVPSLHATARAGINNSAHGKWNGGNNKYIIALLVLFGIAHVFFLLSSLLSLHGD